MAKGKYSTGVKAPHKYPRVIGDFTFKDDGRFFLSNTYLVKKTKDEFRMDAN